MFGMGEANGIVVPNKKKSQTTIWFTASKIIFLCPAGAPSGLVQELFYRKMFYSLYPCDCQSSLNLGPTKSFLKSLAFHFLFHETIMSCSVKGFLIL